MASLPIVLNDQFIRDLAKLKKQNPKLGSKVLELITDIIQSPQNPLSGRGKPEALRGNLSGRYSRRINQEHRLIYKIEADKIVLVSAFGHYEQH